MYHTTNAVTYIHDEEKQKQFLSFLFRKLKHFTFCLLYATQNITCDFKENFQLYRGVRWVKRFRERNNTLNYFKSFCESVNQSSLFLVTHIWIQTTVKKQFLGLTMADGIEVEQMVESRPKKVNIFLILLQAKLILSAWSFSCNTWRFCVWAKVAFTREVKNSMWFDKFLNLPVFKSAYSIKNFVSRINKRENTGKTSTMNFKKAILTCVVATTSFALFCFTGIQLCSDDQSKRSQCGPKLMEHAFYIKVRAISLTN